MIDSLPALLALTTDQERQAWLQAYAPVRDDDFVQALRLEAQHRERENPHKALAVAHLVSLSATCWGDAQTEAVSLHLQANAYLMLAEHRQALALYQQAATIYHELEMELEAARVSVGQLAAMQYLGLYDEAVTLSNWAIDVFQVAGDDLALAKMIMNRGNIFGRQHRLQEARASYVEARDIFVGLQDARHLAMVNANEAIVLTELDNFRKAEAFFREARAYFAAEGMESVVAQVDHNIAYLYMGQGEYQRALLTFNQARTLFAEQENAVEVATIDLLRSDIYLALNLWQEAQHQVELARPVFASREMAWELGRLSLNEAAALARLDAKVAPTTALSQAYMYFATEHNAVWMAVTHLYQATFAWRRGEMDVARAQAQEAAQVFREHHLRSRAAQCDIILGEIALQEQDVDQAIAHFEQGLLQLDDADVPAISYACLYGLGRTHQQRGEVALAQVKYRQAIADVERLQATIGAEDYKIAFLSDKLDVYEKLVSLCLEQDTSYALREAFATVEQAKSRSLLDAIARKNSAIAVSQTEQHLQEEIERLKRELNWYYNRLNQPDPERKVNSPQDVVRLTAAVTRRERALAALLDQWRSPDLITAPRNPIWTVTAAECQSVLPADVLVLEFYTAQESLTVFGLTSETMWNRQLSVTVSQVGEWLSQLRFQMNKFSYGAVYRTRHTTALQRGVDHILHQLYQVLVEPIADLITAPTVVVIPHGLLHYLPFHALFDGSHYLIDQKTISYAPSATILYRLLVQAHETVTAAPVILGMPDAAIPHVEAEVAAVAELFPTAMVQLGAQATRMALTVRETPPAFLHLATHAQFRADNPYFSSLKLADGWLDVTDIYNMPAVAPLVTLSACETGRNQVALGDELVGLCRGFFAAGARSIVVTLWMVDDAAAAHLMQQFYAGLQNGLPVNEALQHAQRDIKATYTHPYYWAPFLLMGSMQTRLFA